MTGLSAVVRKAKVYTPNWGSASELPPSSVRTVTTFGWKWQRKTRANPSALGTNRHVFASHVQVQPKE